MRTVNAYAAPSATDPIVKTTIERRDVGPKDVSIDIAYSGVCHSDIHTVRGEWGPIQYPQVVGHEIVGRVTEVGSDVTKHQVGDLVGVGCMVNSCKECEQCKAGQEQYCLKGNIQTYGGTDPADGTITQGGYSEAVVVDEDFVLRVPESLDIEKVAPLLCAGITTYSPLRHWNAGPGTKVAVVGMGGLGHMAVKIAHAMGAEVTVLSQTLSKKEDGLRLGADRYFATSDDATFTELASSFDLIINTVSATHEIASHVQLLARDGTMIMLGLTTEGLPVFALPLLWRRRRIAGSLIGGIKETQEMLDFCAEHGIACDIETIAPDQINDAYERMLKSDVRYRFVIDMEKMAA